MKNKILITLKAFISVSLISLLCWIMRNKLSIMFNTVVNADRKFVILGFFLIVGATYFLALRLKKIISVQNIRMSLKESIFFTFMGYFFSNFPITSLGEDILKVSCMGKTHREKKGLFAGVFMDRILYVISFIIIPVVIVVFFGHQISNRLIVVLVYSAFLMGMAFIWILLHKNTTKYLMLILKPFRNRLWCKNLINEFVFFNMYLSHKMILLWGLFLSAIVQILYIFAIYIFAKALHVFDVRIGVFFLVVPIVFFVTLLPSLNGLGIREGALVYFLGPYISSEKALAVSVLVLTSLVCTSIVGGFMYIFRKSLFSFKQKIPIATK